MAKDKKEEKKAKGKKGGDAAAKKGGGKKKKGEKIQEQNWDHDYVCRLRQRYRDSIVEQMQKQFNYANANQVPKLDRVVVNMGMGEAVANPKVLDSAAEEIATVTGQKPVITRARKSIANFKLREGMPIGAMVTLRQNRMYEFLDRLMNVALPRVRDFKGVSGKAFDGNGNYTLGIHEQIIFPEINYDKIDKIKGLNVTIVTTAKTDEEGKALLKAFGMPFRN